VVRQTLPRLSAVELADAFGPFVEWNFLARQDKRVLMQDVTPEIHVRDYRVVGISLIMGEVRRDDVNHMAAGCFVATHSRNLPPHRVG
jgi:hypothetical protein